MIGAGGAFYGTAELGGSPLFRRLRDGVFTDAAGFARRLLDPEAAVQFQRRRVRTGYGDRQRRSPLWHQRIRRDRGVWDSVHSDATGLANWDARAKYVVTPAVVHDYVARSTESETTRAHRLTLIREFCRFLRPEEMRVGVSCKLVLSVLGLGLISQHFPTGVLPIES